MPTIYQDVAQKFLTKLSQSKEVDTNKIDQLRTLLANGKRVRAEDFVKVFSAPAGGDIK